MILILECNNKIQHPKKYIYPAAFAYSLTVFYRSISAGFNCIFDKVLLKEELSLNTLKVQLYCCQIIRNHAKVSSKLFDF